MLARPFLFLVLSLLLASTTPSRAQDLPTDAQRHIEQMVARCNGDLTCEAVVRKRETRAAEQRLRRAALKASDPLAYYLGMGGRYLAFVLAVLGAAGLYVFAMRRLFGRKS